MSLIVVVGFNIIFGLMGFNLSGVASHSYSNYTKYYSVEQAQFLAESGLNVAIGSLYQNSGWLYGDSTIHNHTLYYDSAHTQTLGTYSIQAKRTYPSGATYVTFNIVSSYSSMTDSSTIVCNIPSFSSFAMYTCNDGSSPWTGGDTCWGKLHSDSVLNLGELAIGSTPQAAVFNGSVSVGVSIDSSGVTNYNNSNSPKVHPQFKQGAPIMGVKLGWLNNFSAVTTTPGYDSSDFATTKADVFVQLNSDGTIEVDTGAYKKYSDTTLADTSWYHTQLVKKATISTFSNIGVVGIMNPNSNRNLHVRGTLNGKLTIANLGTGNIYIDSNVVYHDTTKDMLGLVARDSMFVSYDSANVKGPVKIQAAILAQTFAAENTNTAWGSTTIYGHAAIASTKQSIQLFGALAQRNRGGVGNGNNGYAKSYKYDNRFAGGSNAAPSYPTLPYFQILSWYDRMNWNTNWWSNW